MANSWYVSSAAYAAIPQLAVSTAYTIGQIVRSLATAVNGNKGVFRCTTAGASGSSEATWDQSNGHTTAQGGATFTCITGNSTYGWGGAAGDIQTVTNAGSGSGFMAPGDTLYVSSDHSETNPSNPTYFIYLNPAWNVATFMISVNRGGSTPPVAGDIAAGALITASSGSLTLDPTTPMYIEGCTFAATAGSVVFNSTNTKNCCLKNCAIQINGSSTAYGVTHNGWARVTLDNTTVQFGNAGQGISSSQGYQFDLTWINTPSAIQGATIPTTLFKELATAVAPVTITCRGVDLSAVTGTLVQGSGVGFKALFDSCKIASGVAVYGASPTSNLDIVELVNCYDGVSTRNERYGSGGKVTTERTITLAAAAGGAVDDIGGFSLKYVSNATGLDKWSFPLEGFWLDGEWSVTLGSARTATVEIVSSASLNNDDISMLLEYQGTSSSPVASFVDSKPATPLTANAAVATSSAAWNSSPATPAYQHLQVTFTPQAAGRVRALVRLGKISTTVYVNPVITIT